MKKLTSSTKFAAISATAVLAAAFAWPALAQTDGLAMLSNITKGEWTVKFREGAIVRKICVRSGRELIQIRHLESNCNRFVVEDGEDKVTVQYTCPGNGYGRTSIRRESRSLLQIESQGIASGQPFELGVEARRTGSC